MRNTDRTYVGYDYKEFYTESSYASRYIDGYHCFGWEADDTLMNRKDSRKVLIRLKRNRKIIHKAELTRLQRHFEDCIKQIEELERSKTKTASAAAFSVGILGTVFMTGATFAAVHDPPLVTLCIFLAIPAFCGWIFPYFLFQKIKRMRSAAAETLIEKMYDEIDEICEKGTRLTELNPDS